MSLQLSPLFWLWRGKLACLPAPKEMKKGLLALVFSHTQNLQSAVSVSRPRTPGHFYQSFFHIINTKNTVTKHLRKIKSTEKWSISMHSITNWLSFQKSTDFKSEQDSPHINKKCLLYCWNLVNKCSGEEKSATKEYRQLIGIGRWVSSVCCFTIQWRTDTETGVSGRLSVVWVMTVIN